MLQFIGLIVSLYVSFGFVFCVFDADFYYGVFFLLL